MNGGRLRSGTRTAGGQGGRVVQGYKDFLVASAGAAATLIGLLFVALSVASAREADHSTRERRIVLGGSSSLALSDIFIVSIASLLGGNRTFAIISIAMAVVGCWGVSRLLPRSIRAGNLKRGAPHRALNFGFAITSVGLYMVQLGLGIALLFDLTSDALIRAVLFILVALYGSALARAWEITWIRVRDPEAAPVQQDRKSRSKNH